LSKEALRMQYFTFIHSIIFYGIIFGVTPIIVLKYSECPPKKIMTNLNNMDLCTELFKTMAILPFCVISNCHCSVSEICALSGFYVP